MKIAFLTMLIILGACGEMHSPDIPVYKVDPERLDKVLSNQNFQCQTNTSYSCPSGIARLIMVNRNYSGSLGVCSGFMIGHSILITNSHCVQNEHVCRDTYVLIHTEYGRYEKRRCQFVVYNKHDGRRDGFYVMEKQVDLAVLYLDRPFTGKYFNVKRMTKEEIAKTERATAWVVDHTGLDKNEPNLTDASISELNCTVSNERHSNSVSLRKCASIGGNSGSVIVDDEQNVIGLLWGGNYDGNTNNSIYDRRNADWALTLVTPSEHFYMFVK